MRGVYSHITPRMRAELKAALQELWEASLHKRALISDRSAVGVFGRPTARPRPVAVNLRSVLASIMHGVLFIFLGSV